jgi:hypothetical protein
MPKPKPGESQKDYVSRCIPVRRHEHPEEDVKQSAAVCYSMYKQAHESSSPVIKIDRFLDEVCGGKKKKKPVSEAKGGKPLCVDCDSKPAKRGSRYCADCAKSRRNALSDFKKSQKKPANEEKKEKNPKCNWKGCTKPATHMSASDYPLCDKHYKEDLKESTKPQDQLCTVCGKPLGNEAFLGAVHGKCARKKHKEVLGKK